MSTNVSSWRLDLVDSLYGELASSESMDTAVRVAGRRLDSAWGLVQLIHHRTGEARPLASFGMGEGDIENYLRVAQLDPWPDFYSRLEASRTGDSMLSQEAVSDSELRATPFYHEFWKPSGLLYTCGAIPTVNEDWGVYIGFPRYEHIGPYSKRHLSAIRYIVRHFHHAASILERVRRAEDRAALRKLALDRLDFAVFVLSGDGKILDANAPARGIMGPGQPFKSTMGRLAGNRPPIRDHLNASLRAVSAEKSRPAKPFRVRISETGDTWAAYMLPVSTGGSSAYCLILLNEDRDSSDSVQAVAQLFGLSVAERAVLVQLMEGASPNEIADARQVSRETVRTQLKSLLAKTGCHRQGQLVALCARLTPPVRRVNRPTW